MLTRLLAMTLVCAGMLACGGGGDGDDPASASNDPTASAGLWKGSTSNGRQAYGVLLSDGTYWVIYTATANPLRIAGAVEGTATSIGGNLSSSDALDFNLEGLGVTAATVTATYSPRNSLSGSIRYPNQTVAFTTKYVSVPAAALSQIAGSYRGTAAVVRAAESVNVSISSSGAINGTSASGCRFAGTATPRTDIAVFDVNVTFAGGVCALGTSTVRGVAFYDASTGQLFSAALNSGRTNGFLTVGTKV